MRQLIVRLGRIKSVIAMTAITTVFSNLFTLLMYSIFLRFGVQLNIIAAFTIATVVCVILTPIISWNMFGLVIEIDNLEQEMRQLATYDSLTGLLTRRAFLEKANAVFNIAKRESFNISILLVDFDEFKIINDQYGHITGDQVLRKYGEKVQDICRKSDLAGRLGGEEFTFLLSHADAKKAEYFAKRFQKIIRDTVVTDDAGNKIQFSISIGLASYPEINTDKIESLLFLADKALYNAKANGKDQTVVYHQVPEV
ncbi:MAG: GGDEF domain-containing protein [Anaerolineaceae bacterium]|nr:GGDEF domain-containing protein [Anaerolineaceae bacterium]